jgi:hypothetical protein
MVVKALGSQGKESFAKNAALRDAAFACDDPLRLTPALVALKDADFQTLDRMGRSSNQMRIASALAAAKRCNKFVIRHNEGMIFHASPQPQRERAACPPSSAPAPHSAVPVPRPSDHSPRGRWRVRGDGFMWTFLAPPQLGDGTLDE